MWESQFDIIIKLRYASDVEKTNTRVGAYKELKDAHNFYLNIRNVLLHSVNLLVLTLHNMIF